MKPVLDVAIAFQKFVNPDWCNNRGLFEAVPRNFFCGIYFERIVNPFFRFRGNFFLCKQLEPPDIPWYTKQHNQIQAPTTTTHHP